MATYQGSCHCGNVAYTLEGEVTEAIDCNCSMCRKRGGLLAFFPRDALTLTTPENSYATYTFNTHKLQHHFCPKCGIAPFSEGVHPGTGNKMAAVNVRCLADVDLAALKITSVDGATA